jgi:replicative DNA helicase
MEQYNSNASIVGLSTGLTTLNEWIGGWVEGELSVIAAKPAQGKTSLLTQALIECGLNNIPAHCFPFEMTKGQMLRRLWAGVANIRFALLRQPQFMPKADLEVLKAAKETVARFPLIIEDNPNLTANQVVSRARISKRRNKTRFIGLDYLQKMHFTSKPEHRHIEVTDAAVKLTNLAKKENLAVVALSSLTEKTGKMVNQLPTLADLRQSGDIQYEAATVLLIHREVDIETQRVKSNGSIIIAKQRNGRTGKFEVHYNDRLLFEPESTSSSQPTAAQQYEMDIRPEAYS